MVQSGKVNLIIRRKMIREQLILLMVMFTIQLIKMENSYYKKIWKATKMVKKYLIYYRITKNLVMKLKAKKNHWVVCQDIKEVPLINN